MQSESEQCEKPDEITVPTTSPNDESTLGEVWIKSEENVEDESNDSESESETEITANDAEPMKDLPRRSKEKYLQTYQNFMTWKEGRKKDSLVEDVFIEYFTELAGKFKPSSLWAQFSMLKSTMLLYNKIDMSSYRVLLAFLSKNAEGYQCRKTHVFTSKQIETFLVQASDDRFLATKVIIFCKNSSIAFFCL